MARGEETTTTYIQLELGLRHERVEEGKVAHLADAAHGVNVHGVEALVELDHHEDLVLVCEGNELVVVCERLHRRLCHEHVDPALDGVLCNVKVRVVGSKNGCHIARLQRVQGLLV